jgi:hypothetical protein
MLTLSSKDAATKKGSTINILFLNEGKTVEINTLSGEGKIKSRNFYCGFQKRLF